MTDSFFLVCWVFASILLTGLIFSHRAFSYLDDPMGMDRNNSIDGLRYVLASLVVFHHIDFHKNYLISGVWGTGSEFIFYIGRFGVDVFFMITAYLFWGKIRKKDNVNWAAIYKGRFFRIFPLATFSSIISIIILSLYFGAPDFTLKTIGNMLTWFDGGFFNIRLPVNDFPRPGIVTSGVTWTLRWEWAFYLFLPIMFFFRNKGLEFAIGSIFVVFYILPFFKETSPYLVSCFAFGILVKELEDRVKINKTIADITVIACVLFLFISKPNALSLAFTPALAIIFLMICSGSNLLGLLTLNGLVRLGNASYSIYLLQGAIFFIAMRMINLDTLKSSGYSFYMLMTLSFIVLCLISSLTYKFIEMFFIKIGKRRVTIPT